jgi:adenosylcobinamide-GDP ribazoletransferase
MPESGRVSIPGTVLAALTFFTRVPRPPLPAYSPSDDDHAAAFAPWIGVVVGLFTAAVAMLGQIAFGTAVGAVLAVLATVWMTGALHEDGLADFCDGFAHAHGRERTLEIMRDPRCGVYGVLAVVGAILTRVVCLYALLYALAPVALIVVLVAIAALSRGFAVAPMRSHDYARAGDDAARGARLSRPLSGGWFVTCALGALTPAVFGAMYLSPLVAVIIVAVMFCAQQLTARAFSARLGGYTGDCLGAVQQFTEVTGLLALVALSKHTLL